MKEDRIFTQRRVWLFGRLIPALYLFMAAKFLFRGDWLIAHDGSRLWTDFLAIWSAGDQAHHGGAASVYGISALDAVQNAVVSNLAGLHLPFAYPPTFLLVAVPLSGIPYVLAFLAWQALTLCLYAGAVYLIIPRREAVLLALAFPAVFSNAYVGQEGLLAAALFAGSLALLDRRPILAGVALGLLTFRPQLGILFPIVLIFTGRWRVFGSAAITALCLAAASFIFFGMDAWRAFFGHAAEHAAATLSDGQAAGSWAMLQSVYALVRSLGGTSPLAWFSHILVAGLAALLVLRVWMQRPIRYELKAAALGLGAAIVTPYLYFYDLSMLAIPVAFLIADGLKHGFARFERIAILAAAISTATFIAGLFAPIGPFITAIIAAIIVVRIRSQTTLARS
jgi:arabinofuranan 3-O-arabinosyltransferase